MDQLPSDKFSQTFSDAITVVKRLGGRFLWIDSLCIVQDDKEDWNHESSLMHKVYSLSTLTIAASHGKSGKAGIFSGRNPCEMLSCPLPSPFSDEEDRGQYFYFQPVLAGGPWQINVEESPLCQRAWVFQEQLLSPRTLYFGKEQLLWACGEMEACESYPDPALFPKIDMTFSSRRLLVDAIRKNEEAPWKNPSWDSLVRTYSATKITFPTDRIHSLTGFFEALVAKAKVPYAYGTFLDETVAYSLLWFRYDTIPDARPLEFIAPSWSWLTFHRPGVFRHWMWGVPLIKELAFMDCDNVPSPAELRLKRRPVARTRNAIVIRTRLKITWVREHLPNEQPMSDSYRYKMALPTELGLVPEEPFVYESYESLVAQYNDKFHEHQRNSDKYFYHDFFLDDKDDEIHTNFIICAPVLNYGADLSQFEGLILQPVANETELSNPVVSKSAEGLFNADVRRLPTFRRLGTYMTGACWHSWVAGTEEMDIALI